MIGSSNFQISHLHILPSNPIVYKKLSYNFISIKLKKLLFSVTNDIYSGNFLSDQRSHSAILPLFKPPKIVFSSEDSNFLVSHGENF